MECAYQVESTLKCFEQRPVDCQLGCGEVYCSVDCCAAAHTGGHRLLCVGPLTSTSHPLYRFKKAAVETEEFLLAAQVMAAVVCDAQARAAAVHATAATAEHVDAALTPYVALLCGSPWWDVRAPPPEQQAASFRRALQTQAKHAWQLLTQGLHEARSLPCLPLECESGPRHRG
jgi:hypothetical protein